MVPLLLAHISLCRTLSLPPKDLTFLFIITATGVVACGVGRVAGLLRSVRIFRGLKMYV